MNDVLRRIGGQQFQEGRAGRGESAPRTMERLALFARRRALLVDLARHVATCLGDAREEASH
eukprot:6996448-Pyramimonas_sp.AAC.1